MIDINDIVIVFNTNVTRKLYAEDLKLYACLLCSSSRLVSTGHLTHWKKLGGLKLFSGV